MEQSKSICIPKLKAHSCIAGRRGGIGRLPLGEQVFLLWRLDCLVVLLNNVDEISESLDIAKRHEDHGAEIGRALLEHGDRGD